MTTGQITFNGTEREQEVAQLIFRVMVAGALLFASNAPIRRPLDELVEFLADNLGLSREEAQDLTLASLNANQHIFALEELDGMTVVATTKAGKPPAPVGGPDTRHMLVSRLYEPPPEAVRVPVEPTYKTWPEEAWPEKTAEAPEAAVELTEARVTAAPPGLTRPAVTPTKVRVAPDVVVDLTKSTADIVTEYGPYIEKILVKALSEDVRFVRFGRLWFLEQGLMRFSKGDVKRIREWIREVVRPLTDVEILELMGRKPTERDFELTRFSLNVKLAREKGFEFVGTENHRLWATDELPPIGLQRRRPAEIGPDLRHLEDPQFEPLPEGPVQSWTHTITWFEFENGILPFDGSAKSILPKPFLEDQKSAVLMFDSPQLRASYLVELHYPTPSRGGWISGLEAFFQEALIPGAVVTVRPTAEEYVFVIEYTKVPQQHAQLLTYDEKKRRFQFKTVTYSCEVDQSMLLTAARFGRLDRTERLDDSARRRLETVVAWAFHIVGEPVEDERLMAFLQDLHPVVNIERPFNRAYLKHLLASGQVAQVTQSTEDEDLFFFSTRDEA